ncbi:hypothetical protein V6Z11_D07G194500 [Gossypium hirsutum]
MQLLIHMAHLPAMNKTISIPCHQTVVRLLFINNGPEVNFDHPLMQFFPDYFVRLSREQRVLHEVKILKIPAQRRCPFLGHLSIILDSLEDFVIFAVPHILENDDEIRDRLDVQHSRNILNPVNTSEIIFV